MKKVIMLILTLLALTFSTACQNQPTEEIAANTISETVSELLPTETTTAQILTETEDEKMKELTITVDEQVFTLTLYENETAAAFAEMLPMTLDMSELNGNEKYYYLDESLPTNPSVPNSIHTGDLMLYGSSCLVLFYEDFPTSYSYTPIGYTNNPEGLKKALGRRSAEVTFSVN